jgi:hypothetical protein
MGLSLVGTSIKLTTFKVYQHVRAIAVTYLVLSVKYNQNQIFDIGSFLSVLAIHCGITNITMDDLQNQRCPALIP